MLIKASESKSGTKSMFKTLQRLMLTGLIRRTVVTLSRNAEMRAVAPVSRAYKKK